MTARGPSGRALVLAREGEATRAGIVVRAAPVPQDGEILVRVHYSAINYKDALAVSGRGRILRRSPLVGGIDAAGIVVASRAPGWEPGTAVVAAGAGLGEDRDGGYADYLCAPASVWTPLPEGLSLFEAAALGSAGLTAALARARLESAGLGPATGEIVVSGASGGVGSFALDILSRGGYRVLALSGRPELREELIALGARDVLPPPSPGEPLRGLARAEWAGAIDNVGGPTLTWILERIRRGGKVVAVGMAASSTVTLSVFPFILRAVDLLGLNSTEVEPGERARVWSLLAGPWRPAHLARIVTRTVALEEVPRAVEDVLARRHRGRWVVRLAGEESAPAC